MTIRLSLMPPLCHPSCLTLWGGGGGGLHTADSPHSGSSVRLDLLPRFIHTLTTQTAAGLGMTLQTACGVCGAQTADTGRRERQEGQKFKSFQSLESLIPLMF